ncbi:MAG: NADH-quinone oxidoreductase subunit NuoF [Candidatus Binataceae bacterium]|jgi:NADH-quinone oxidoreductase subunit F
MLSEETCRRIQEQIARFPHARGALLGALHLALADAGQLSHEVFAELAPMFGMRACEVAEVASFYPSFNLPPARAVIQVCTNLSCCLRGARSLVEDLEQRLGVKAGHATPDGRFAIAEVECLGSCATAPVIQVNDNPFLENVTPELLDTLVSSPEAAIAARQTAPINSWIPPEVEGYLLPPNGERWLTLDDYKAHGGYQSVTKAAQMAPKDIAKLVQDAGLRGRGGAGFVVGLKWSFMPPKDQRPRYLAINADESEPGTFKDRQIMERNPHLLLEGIMIACLALEANGGYIYVRCEYNEAHRRVSEALEQCYQAGILGDNALGFNRRFDIRIQRGGGAYICGEESGMLESMEGKKGQPRKRPPFPAQYGLWGQPTTVDNVESLSHVPAIIRNGAQWFQQQGIPNSAGHTLFGISGHINRPGVIELPLGVKLRDLIEKYAEGTLEGRGIKAIIPGGVSMPVLKPDKIDAQMGHETLKAVGSLLGTGGVIVMDDRSCMVRAALVIARFFEHESCGQCTQCREGTGWIYKTLKRIEGGTGTAQDLDNIARCASFMEGQTICAFADAAAWAAKGFLTQFRPDFEAHVDQHRCPFSASFKA